MILPEHLVENYGIPKELIDIADIRRTAFSTVEPYYHILECLGVFMMDKNRMRLLSDFYDKTAEDDGLYKELAEVQYVKKSERAGEDDEDEDEEETFDEE